METKPEIIARQRAQAKHDIKVAAVHWFAEFIQEDHDAQEMILRRAGVPHGDPIGYELMWEAFDELKASIRKAGGAK